MKPWFNYLVYISIVFLLIALYKADYLVMQRIVSFPALLSSFLFLFTGFIMHAVSWNRILKMSSHNVSLSSCIAGTGLSVFGKYIPGKVWTVVGRAAYINEKYNIPLGRLSAISLNAELIQYWLGLMIGACGLFFFGGLRIWGWLTLFLWLGLTVVIFSSFVQSGVEALIKKMLNKEISIPNLTIRSTFSILHWFLLFWGILSIGFYLFMISISVVDIPVMGACAFPLASTLGIMAVIVPGGIGVREGILVGFLSLAGITVIQAVAISVAARLWFLIGEGFLFALGLISNQVSSKKLLYKGL